MRPPYKVEIFDRDMSFRGFTATGRPDIAFDYLTLEHTTLTIPQIPADKGDYAHITDAAGQLVYQGIVSDVGIKKTTVELNLAPLQSLFDLTVSYDRRDLQTGSLENFIAGIIRGTYIQNPDVLQNIPGLTVSVSSSTMNTKLNIKSNVHEFYDIITKAFTMYGIIVDMQLYPATKKLTTAVRKVNMPELIIESRLANVTHKNFVIGDSYGQLNKLTLLNKNNEAEAVTYFLHADGTVDSINRDRVTPVFPAVEYVESDEFPSEAEKRAAEKLTPQKHNNLIELTFRDDDQIISIPDCVIGRAATIIDEEIYSSVLTGYTWRGQSTMLVFGNVRADLTKKLILERRRQND